MRYFCALSAAVLFGAASHVPAWADEAAQTMEQWYSAVSAADAEALGAIMDDGAQVTLNDIGITQTKAEFLDSMNEWADAIAGGSISHKLMNGDMASGLVVRACYRFSSGEQLNNEAFTFDDGRILSSIQTKLADDCSGF
jgi:hypothetical protein